MRRTFTLTLLCVLTAPVLLAQQDRLGIGLNAQYPGPRQLGLGVSIDFQHQLCPHWELLGLLSASRSFLAGRRDERMILDYKSSTLGFLGAGVGYRSGTEARGFHAGLLAGTLLNPTIRYDAPNDMQLLPAMGLSIGHSIGQRGDLCADMVLGRAADRTYPGFLALRYSFQLFRKKE